MQRMKRVLAVVAALGLLLSAMLFDNRPVVYADDPQPTPTPTSTSGTSPNGGGSGGGQTGK
jgi:hypothetical protein